MGRILDRDGKPIGLHITPRGNVVFENTLENSIHEGRRFFHQSYQDVAASDEITFLFVPAEGYDLHLDVNLEANVEVTVLAYFGVTVGDYGTQLLILNNNQNFAQTSPNAKVYKDATIINGDEILTVGNKITANKNASAGRSNSGEFVLAYPYKSFMKLTAEEGSGFISWQIGMSEVASGTYY